MEVRRDNLKLKDSIRESFTLNDSLLRFKEFNRDSWVIDCKSELEIPLHPISDKDSSPLIQVEWLQIRLMNAPSTSRFESIMRVLSLPLLAIKNWNAFCILETMERSSLEEIEPCC